MNLPELPLTIISSPAPETGNCEHCAARLRRFCRARGNRGWDSAYSAGTNCAEQAVAKIRLLPGALQMLGNARKLLLYVVAPEDFSVVELMMIVAAIEEMCGSGDVISLCAGVPGERSPDELSVTILTVSA